MMIRGVALFKSTNMCQQIRYPKYALGQVDNTMICSGRQVEIECFELMTKAGLISKCVYLNQLLNDANMNETHLDSDPVFKENGKVVLLFSSNQDAENFVTKQVKNFRVTIKERNSKECSLASTKQSSNGIENSKPNNAVDQISPSKSILKSSVAAIETSKNNKLILKTDFNLDHVNDLKFKDSNELVSTNSNQAKISDGYEILTIRAKLKQRVNQNRTKNVSLGDIDLIMRNVVTIIQEEFMKRFPSGSSSSVSKNGEFCLSRN